MRMHIEIILKALLVFLPLARGVPTQETEDEARNSHLRKNIIKSQDELWGSPALLQFLQTRGMRQRSHDKDENARETMTGFGDTSNHFLSKIILPSRDSGSGLPGSVANEDFAVAQDQERALYEASGEENKHVSIDTENDPKLIVKDEVDHSNRKNMRSQANFISADGVGRVNAKKMTSRDKISAGGNIATTRMHKAENKDHHDKDQWLGNTHNMQNSELNNENPRLLMKLVTPMRRQNTRRYMQFPFKGWFLKLMFGPRIPAGRRVSLAEEHPTIDNVASRGYRGLRVNKDRNAYSFDQRAKKMYSQYRGDEMTNRPHRKHRNGALWILNAENNGKASRVAPPLLGTIFPQHARGIRGRRKYPYPSPKDNTYTKSFSKYNQNMKPQLDEENTARLKFPPRRWLERIVSKPLFWPFWKSRTPGTPSHIPVWRLIHLLFRPLRKFKRIRLGVNPYNQWTSGYRGLRVITGKNAYKFDRRAKKLYPRYQIDKMAQYPYRHNGIRARWILNAERNGKANRGASPLWEMMFSQHARGVRERRKHGYGSPSREVTNLEEESIISSDPRLIRIRTFARRIIPQLQSKYEELRQEVPDRLSVSDNKVKRILSRIYRPVWKLRPHRRLPDIRKWFHALREKLTSMFNRLRSTIRSSLALRDSAQNSKFNDKGEKPEYDVSTMVTKMTESLKAVIENISKRLKPYFVPPRKQNTSTISSKDERKLTKQTPPENNVPVTATREEIFPELPSEASNSINAQGDTELSQNGLKSSNTSIHQDTSIDRVTFMNSNSAKNEKHPELKKLPKVDRNKKGLGHGGVPDPGLLDYPDPDDVIKVKKLKRKSLKKELRDERKLLKHFKDLTRLMNNNIRKMKIPLPRNKVDDKFQSAEQSLAGEVMTRKASTTRYEHGIIGDNIPEDVVVNPTRRKILHVVDFQGDGKPTVSKDNDVPTLITDYRDASGKMLDDLASLSGVTIMSRNRQNTKDENIHKDASQWLSSQLAKSRHASDDVMGSNQPIDVREELDADSEQRNDALLISNIVRKRKFGNLLSKEPREEEEFDTPTQKQEEANHVRTRRDTALEDQPSNNEGKAKGDNDGDEVKGVDSSDANDKNGVQISAEDETVDKLLQSKMKILDKLISDMRSPITSRKDSHHKNDDKMAGDISSTPKPGHVDKEETTTVMVLSKAVKSHNEESDSDKKMPMPLENNVNDREAKQQTQKKVVAIPIYKKNLKPRKHIELDDESETGGFERSSNSNKKLQSPYLSYKKDKSSERKKPTLADLKLLKNIEILTYRALGKKPPNNSPVEVFADSLKMPNHRSKRNARRNHENPHEQDGMLFSKSNKENFVTLRNNNNQQGLVDFKEEWKKYRGNTASYSQHLQNFIVKFIEHEENNTNQDPASNKTFLSKFVHPHVERSLLHVNLNTNLHKAHRDSFMKNVLNHILNKMHGAKNEISSGKTMKPKKSKTSRRKRRSARKNLKHLIKSNRYKRHEKNLNEGDLTADISNLRIKWNQLASEMNRGRKNFHEATQQLENSLIESDRLATLALRRGTHDDAAVESDKMDIKSHVYALKNDEKLSQTHTSGQLNSDVLRLSTGADLTPSETGDVHDSDTEMDVHLREAYAAANPLGHPISPAYADDSVGEESVGENLRSGTIGEDGSLVVGDYPDDVDAETDTPLPEERRKRSTREYFEEALAHDSASPINEHLPRRKEKGVLNNPKQSTGINDVNEKDRRNEFEMRRTTRREVITRKSVTHTRRRRDTDDFVRDEVRDARRMANLRRRYQTLKDDVRKFKQTIKETEIDRELLGRKLRHEEMGLTSRKEERLWDLRRRHNIAEKYDPLAKEQAADFNQLLHTAHNSAENIGEGADSMDYMEEYYDDDYYEYNME